MAAVVEALRARLAAMSRFLQQGLEVTKFSRKGLPSRRVLWMPKDGTLCISRPRRAKRDKAVRLEDISRVVCGASAPNFIKSPQFSTLVAGAEQCCVSVYGDEDGTSFHFRLGGVTGDGGSTGQVLVELLQALVRQVAGVGTAAEKRAQSLNYARTGNLLPRYAAQKREMIGMDVSCYEAPLAHYLPLARSLSFFLSFSGPFLLSLTSAVTHSLFLSFSLCLRQLLTLTPQAAPVSRRPDSILHHCDDTLP